MTIIIAFGNAFDGLSLVGPFENYEDADQYAQAHRADYEEYNLVEVTEPDGDAGLFLTSDGRWASLGGPA